MMKTVSPARGHELDRKWKSNVLGNKTSTSHIFPFIADPISFPSPEQCSEHFMSIEKGIFRPTTEATSFQPVCGNMAPARAQVAGGGRTRKNSLNGCLKVGGCGAHVCKRTEVVPLNATLEVLSPLSPA